MAKLPVKSGSSDPSKTVAKLKELFANKRSDLAWHHEVGRLVDQIVSERSHGKTGVPNLAEQLGEKENFIYKLLAFVRLYDETDVPKLDGLTFGHVTHLLSVKNATLRDEFRQQCQQHRCSVVKLLAAITERLGTRSRGGRPVSTPTKVGPSTALRTTIRLSDSWQQKCVPALEENLTVLAKRMKRKPDEDLVKLVDDTCIALDKLHAAVREARTKLTAIRAASKSNH
jgi:hypothetical protein